MKVLIWSILIGRKWIELRKNILLERERSKIYLLLSNEVVLRREVGSDG